MIIIIEKEITEMNFNRYRLRNLIYIFHFNIMFYKCCDKMEFWCVFVAPV